mmetsp:Transcript_12767/g.17615  ORF Transcript_12767/g.17615 Transcript_12767/m.17615 type:complete len:432 (-) Transcript_12767:338-1633(-)
MLRLRSSTIQPKVNLTPINNSLLKTKSSTPILVRQPIYAKNGSNTIFGMQIRSIYTTKEMIRRRQILEKLRQASVKKEILPYNLDDVEPEDEVEDVEEAKVDSKIETIPALPAEEEDTIDVIDAISDFSTERAVRDNIRMMREKKKLHREQAGDEAEIRREAFRKLEDQREQKLAKELLGVQPAPYEHEDIEAVTKRQQKVETNVTRKTTLPKLHGTTEEHQFRSEQDKEKFLQSMDKVVETLPEDDGLTDEERTELSTAILQMNPSLARLNIVLKTRNFPEKKHQQLILSFVQTFDEDQPLASPEDQVIPKVQNPEFGIRDIALTEEEFFLPSELLRRSKIIVQGNDEIEPEYTELCRFCVEGSHYFDALNVPLLTRFMTKAGRIIPRKYTGLCGKHQRKVAKTIKMARNMGIFSYKKGDFQIHSPFATM